MRRQALLFRGMAQRGATVRITCGRAPLNGGRLFAAVHDSALDLFNRLRDVDAARAGLGAVVDRAAEPDTVAVAQDVEAVGCGSVAAIEDEAVGVDDGGRAYPLRVGPHGRARPRA